MNEPRALPHSADGEPLGPAAWAAQPEALAGARPGTSRVGMWIFLGSDAMSFAGLLFARGMLRLTAGDAWPTAASQLGPKALPLACVGTAILLASSVTLALAGRALGDAAQEVDPARARRERGQAFGWLLATLLLGLGFLGYQAYEYSQLWGRGLGTRTSHFFSSFFLLTGFHGLHVAVGVVLIGLGTSRAMDHDLDGERLAVIGLYWHFVDLVWLAILTAVYLV